MISRPLCMAVTLCFLADSPVASAWLYVIPRDSLSDPIAGLSGQWFDASKRQDQVPIYGYYINSSGYYFFVGETKDLNRFLLRTSQATKSENVRSWYQQVSCHIVLHPGSGYVRIPGLHGGRTSQRSQWKMDVLRSTELSADRSEVLPKLTINIHVWKDDRIHVADMAAPPGFTIVSGRNVDSSPTRRLPSRPTGRQPPDLIAI